MEQQSPDAPAAKLDALIGEWTLEASFPRVPDAPDAGSADNPARTRFEWMSGSQFVVQRWEIPLPEAPDGLAVLGWDEGLGSLLQHYFDSRGVARVYEMTLDGGVWTLERSKPDFSPLDFHQRFSGTFSEDGKKIEGAWEICQDGSTWEHDFDLIYTRIAS